MARLELSLDSGLSPQQVVDALTDFSDRRPDVWPYLAREFYEVYSVGETTADVREGSTKPFKIWSREDYDWSIPGRVSWTVRESNFCTPGDGIVATVSPGGTGGSHIQLAWKRHGVGWKGRFIVALMMLTRGKPLIFGFREGFEKIERGVT